MKEYIKENKKCCWSGCKKYATISLSTCSSEGSLDMCKECHDLYSNHCDAREKLFREEGFNDALSKESANK